MPVEERLHNMLATELKHPLRAFWRSELYDRPPLNLMADPLAPGWGGGCRSATRGRHLANFERTRS